MTRVMRSQLKNQSRNPFQMVSLLFPYHCVESVDDDYALALQLQMEEERLYQASKSQESSKSPFHTPLITRSSVRPSLSVALGIPIDPDSDCGCGGGRNGEVPQREQSVYRR